MRIYGVKYNKGTVKIVYTDQTKTGSNEKITLECTEPPLDDFNLALQNLRGGVCEICDFPEEYETEIRVIGISFTYIGKDHRMGVVISSLKNIHTDSPPLIINTPFTMAASQSGSDYSYTLSSSVIAAITLLLFEAKRYLDGDRLAVQPELFDEVLDEAKLTISKHQSYIEFEQQANELLDVEITKEEGEDHG